MQNSTASVILWIRDYIHSNEFSGFHSYQPHSTSFFALAIHKLHDTSISQLWFQLIEVRKRRKFWFSNILYYSDPHSLSQIIDVGTAQFQAWHSAITIDSTMPRLRIWLIICGTWRVTSPSTTTFSTLSSLFPTQQYQSSSCSIATRMIDDLNF